MKRRRSKKGPVVGIILLLIAAGVAYERFSTRSSSDHLSITEHVQAESADKIERYEIQSGDTFGIICETLGIDTIDTAAILSASNGVYDFTSIRVGKTLDFYFDRDTSEFKKLIYQPNTEERILVLKQPQTDEWLAESSTIQYEIRTKTISGTIDSSLYETALESGFDERAIINLAETFAWQIDFAIDIRTGDSFKVVLEERYLENEYIMPGQILAASFDNAGEKYEGFYYFENEENNGYFDRDGASLQKIFLKSPLQYRYISSRFGGRRDPITRAAAWHAGIDYAAPYGTPSVTVGNGTVVHAGWDGGYGNSVDIRHNETYTTRYGHFSNLAVSYGDTVEQGEVIGYVGSTGWSTGPHLHYEMHKFGSQVNPFTVDIPAGKALAEDSMPAFQKHVEQFDI